MSIVSLPLPVQLLNGNVADGGQVMTDLNAIASNVNANAAKNGVNNDITQLTALISINSNLTATGWTATNWTINTSEIVSPTITGGTLDGTITGVTQPVGTASAQPATMQALLNQAFATSLPSISVGVTDYFVTNNGAIGSWGRLLKSGTIRFSDSSDNTKLLAFNIAGFSTATTRTITIPDATSTMATIDATQTLTNKTLVDSSTFFSDNGDETKKLQFQLSGITTGTTRTLTIPDVNGTIVTTQPALVLLATITPTVAANVDFLSTFTSTYDSYLIALDGVLPSGNDTLAMRFGVAGVADAGSNYFSSSNLGSAYTTSSASINVGSSVIAAGKGASGTVTVCNVNDATNLKSIIGLVTVQTNATPGFSNSWIGGAYNPSNSVSGVRLFWVGGSNFVATGKVRVYAYQNS